jgi:hypothetical protein
VTGATFIDWLEFNHLNLEQIVSKCMIESTHDRSISLSLSQKRKPQYFLGYQGRQTICPLLLIEDHLAIFLQLQHALAGHRMWR